MSDSRKPSKESGFDALTDRLRKSLSCEAAGDNTNKPDFRELDLGSPVSPLRTGPAPTPSSSSSSSGSVSGRNVASHSAPKKSDSGNNSGELSVESSPTFGPRALRRSESGSGSGSVSHSHPPPSPSVYSGGSVSSPAVNVLPTGNICPSGKFLKTGMATRSAKTDVLGLGTGNYGHGSIMRGGAAAKTGGGGGGDSPLRLGGSGSRGSVDPEELKRLGNEQYKRGNFLEALGLYDRAIGLSPGNAAYHCNRAAALMGLKRLSEAVRECDEAIRLDSGYVRAHHRLGSLLLSLGQVENARRHLNFPGSKPDQVELLKLQAVEKHLSRCTDARKMKDWSNVLRECDSAVASGADSSPQLFACRAEALLKLRQLNDADTSLSNMPKFDATNLSCSQAKCFGMLCEAYILFVRAQIDMALGRFESAVTSIEKAGQVDPRNLEISVLLQNIKSVARARARGNDLFKSERYTEACAAYAEGLRLDPSNSVLYCNRAACWYKLGQWEKSLDDCNQALQIHPNYTKALLRRAASNTKLERWDESVRDYEVLRKELPNNRDIAENLFHAQVALKKSRGEEVHNMKFGGEVELVTGLEQFKAAIASTGTSVVLFKTASDLQCKQISPFLDTLCTRYPSINFLKVDVEESPAIASAENVRIVPTFKIYKKGTRVKEMVCPSSEVLESSVMHYSF